jgi:hypothetical protein
MHAPDNGGSRCQPTPALTQSTDAWNSDRTAAGCLDNLPQGPRCAVCDCRRHPDPLGRKACGPCHHVAEALRLAAAKCGLSLDDAIARTQGVQKLWAAEPLPVGPHAAGLVPWPK